MNPLLKDLEHCLDHEGLVITGSFMFQDTPFNFSWKEASKLFKLWKTSPHSLCPNRNEEEEDGMKSSHSLFHVLVR